MESLGRHLPAFDRLDAAVSHFSIHAGAVEQAGEIILKAHFLIENGIPNRITRMSVAVEIFQPEFFYDAGFTVVVGAAHPHPDLAGSVAAEHRTFMDNKGFYTMPGSSQSSTHTCQTAADHAKLHFMPDSFHNCFSEERCYK